MDCASAREAVSAILDGEDPGTDPGGVAEHLAGCPACRDWRDVAHEVTRRARLRPALPDPVGAAEVIAAVGSPRRVPRWPGALALARVSLVVVAAGQLALTAPSLLLGHDHSAPVHVAHEMGSFDAALAVGFLVAAWRPGLALGMRAIVGAVAVLLVVTAVVDLALGRTGLADEAPHLLAVAGWLLVCYLAAVTPPGAEPVRTGLAHPSGWRLRRPPAGLPYADVAARPGPVGGASVLATGGAPAGQRPRDGAATCGCAGSPCECPGCTGHGRAAVG